MVKKLLKISVLSIVVLLYCFVLGNYSGVTAGRATVSSTSADEQIEASSISSNLYGHTEQTEILGTNSSLIRPAVKKTFNHFSVFSITATELLFTPCLLYLNFSKRIDIGLPKPDLIFPFHYFW